MRPIAERQPTAVRRPTAAPRIARLRAAATGLHQPAATAPHPAAVVPFAVVVAVPTPAAEALTAKYLAERRRTMPAGPE